MWRIPLTPLVLGLAGLIPFFATALATHTPEALAAAAPLGFLAYGAVILSFLGGARWGMELTRAPAAPSPMRLIWCMLPSIYAWFAVLAFEAQRLAITGSPSPALVAGLIVPAFVAQWLWDEAGARARLTPAWYPALRRLLTAGVLTASAILAFAPLP